MSLTLPGYVSIPTDTCLRVAGASPMIISFFTVQLATEFEPILKWLVRVALRSAGTSKFALPRLLLCKTTLGARVGGQMARSAASVGRAAHSHGPPA